MAKRLLLALALTLWAVSAAADEGLTIDKELDRPAVRLVAVEFYATWCKPCMEAVPKWKALHEKYRDKGLRLIVVAVQDDGRCTNPGWSPDRMICDEDGRISEAFRVGQNLPAAFLWSWRGKMLVQRGHVAEVEKAVQAELASVPRVTIGVNRSGPDGAQLSQISDLLRSELRKTGKLEVVASVEERDLLERIRRESQKAGYAENSQCKIGEEVAANSLIKASLQRNSKEPKLLLQLFSAETGCLLQSGLAPWRPDNADVAVAVAVADLMARLRTETEMPASAKVATVAKKPFGGTSVETAKDVEVEDVEEAIVKFLSEPNAAVFVGDKMVCAKTPCSKSVALGKPSVTMSAEDYQTRTESVVITKSTKEVSWALKPDFALVNVTCGGNTVDVRIDGQSAGSCPLNAQRLKPGKHRVALDSPCHLGVEEAFQIARGDRRDISLAVTPRQGVVTIKATSSTGDDLAGFAFLDGKQLGEVPGSFKVPICGKNLEVRADGHANWTGVLKLAEGEKAKVMSELRKLAAPAPGQQLTATADADEVVRGPFTWELMDGFAVADMSESERRRDQQKIATLEIMIKTIQAMVDRDPRQDNIADLYFRLAESKWEIAQFAHLQQLADYALAWKQWRSAPPLQRPAKPHLPVADQSEAIAVYEKIVMQVPNYKRMDEVLYRLGVAALQMGEARGDKGLANKGVQYLNKLLQNFQQSRYIAQTHLALAEHFFRHNNLTLAKMNYEKILQNYKNAPSYAYAFYQLGWVYYNLREFRRAYESLQEVERLLSPGPFLDQVRADEKEVAAAL